MQIELSHDDLQLLREVLRQRLLELDQELSRTDRVAFKRELRGLERSLERVLGEISAAVEPIRT